MPQQLSFQPPRRPGPPQRLGWRQLGSPPGSRRPAAATPTRRTWRLPTRTSSPSSTRLLDLTLTVLDVLPCHGVEAIRIRRHQRRSARPSDCRSRVWPTDGRLNRRLAPAASGMGMHWDSCAIRGRNDVPTQTVVRHVIQVTFGFDGRHIDFDQVVAVLQLALTFDDVAHPNLVLAFIVRLRRSGSPGDIAPSAAKPSMVAAAKMSVFLMTPSSRRQRASQHVGLPPS